jgi:hypothetical protein
VSSPGSALRIVFEAVELLVRQLRGRRVEHGLPAATPKTRVERAVARQPQEHRALEPAAVWAAAASIFPLAWTAITAE